MHRAIHYLTALVFALFSFLFLGQVNALPVVEDEKVLAKRTFSSQNCPTNEVNLWNKGCKCTWPFSKDAYGTCGLADNSLCLANKNCQSNNCQVTKKVWGFPIKQCIANNAGGEQQK